MSSAKEPKTTYFKFMKFGPNTRLSLYMLLKHRSLFFAYKNVLNDPTDCSPLFYNELQDNQLQNRLKEIAGDKDEEAENIEDANRILELFNSEVSLETKSRVPPKRSSIFKMYNFGYSHQETKEGVAREFIEYHMKSHANYAKIFSTSATWNEGKLWAHYSDSHKGLCIELGGIETQPEGTIFNKVEYTTKRPQISVVDLKSMRTNNKIREEVLNRMFFTKSNGWSYEEEYRIVVSRKNALQKVLLSLPEGQYLEFPKVRIKSLYFGMNSSADNMRMTVDLLKQFYPKSNLPILYRVSQSNDNYEIMSTNLQGVYEDSDLLFYI